jgi:hypothetical protein
VGGFWFRETSRCRRQGVGLKIRGFVPGYSSEFRDACSGSGFKVQGPGFIFRVQGLGLGFRV